MTDFEGRTTSNIVEVEDKEAVKRLNCEYIFDDAYPRIDDKGLTIWGYSWFMVEREVCIDENEDELKEEEKTYDRVDATSEFLNRLAKFILKGNVLEIHEIGCEGVRFPFTANKTTVEGQYGAEFETFF